MPQKAQLPVAPDKKMSHSSIPHPRSRTALIPIILTHPDGRQQRYWISLKRFMEERNKGAKMTRLQRTPYESVIEPNAKPKEWEIDFIENLDDFRKVMLEYNDDIYTVKIVSEVQIEKNNKPFITKQLKINTHKIARAILAKLLGKTGE